MSEPIGIQGSPGAYHEQAARQLYGHEAEIVYIPTFGELFKALGEGKIGIAVAAIANVSVGFIDEPHEELVGNPNLWIAGETYVPVRHQLLGLEGATLETIDTVHSMAPALRQCQRNLRNRLPDATLIEESDTARSAEIVRELDNRTHAAVASEEAGRLNGLTVLAEDIQDDPNNITRFLAFKRRAEGERSVTGQENKSTILLKTPDKAGALFKALAPFTLTGTNISTLHSSFVEAAGFRPQFLMDFDAGLSTRKTKVVLWLLNRMGCDVSVLGTYMRQDPNTDPKLIDTSDSTRIEI